MTRGCLHETVSWNNFHGHLQDLLHEIILKAEGDLQDLQLNKLYHLHKILVPVAVVVVVVAVVVVVVVVVVVCGCHV